MIITSVVICTFRWKLKLNSVQVIRGLQAHMNNIYSGFWFTACIEYNFPRRQVTHSSEMYTFPSEWQCGLKIYLRFIIFLWQKKNWKADRIFVSELSILLQSVVARSTNTCTHYHHYKVQFIDSTHQHTTSVSTSTFSVALTENLKHLTHGAKLAQGT